MKGVFSILFALVLLVGLGLVTATPADAQKGIGKESGTAIISNGIYDVSVEDVTEGYGLGTYTVSTGTGHRQPNQDVLFGGVARMPWSTYLTIRSYSTSTEYVSTSSSPTPSDGYGLVNLDTVSETGFSTPTATSAVTWWDMDPLADPDDLYIEQVIELAGTTLADSRIRVSTEVRNTGNHTIDIGIRYQWDLMIDGEDGSWFRQMNPDGSWISTEDEWALPAFERFETTNDPDEPVFSIFGGVTGPTALTPPATPPDLLQFAAWGSTPEVGLFDFAFDFTPTGRTIAGSAYDSAVAYYWGNTEGNAIRLEAEESIIVTQYLYVQQTGTGEGVTETVTDGTLDAKDVADTEVEVDGTATVTVFRYAENPGGDDPVDFNALGKWVDVYVPDTSQATQIEIRLYYTDAELAAADVDDEEALQILWWDGDEWQECSDSGVHTNSVSGYSGYMWARIRSNTTPSLSQLQGTEFGGYEHPTTPPSGGCFIATAAYGTDTARQLDILREFRDEVLLPDSLGARLVSFYYNTSPPIADFVSQHELVRTAVRVGFVDPIVRILNWSHVLWST